MNLFSEIEISGLQFYDVNRYESKFGEFDKILKTSEFILDEDIYKKLIELSSKMLNLIGFVNMYKYNDVAIDELQKSRMINDMTIS